MGRYIGQATVKLDSRLNQAVTIEVGGGAFAEMTVSSASCCPFLPPL